jgi:hypothetical protein
MAAFFYGSSFSAKGFDCGSLSYDESRRGRRSGEPKRRETGVKNSRVADFGTVILALFGFSFLLNFFWESVQAVYLYQKHDFRADKYVRMSLYVTFVDTLLIVGIYLFTAFAFRNLLWERSPRKGEVILFSLAAFGLAAFIEYRAIFWLHRWAYAEAMPVIFGIGLFPLFQLWITGLGAIWLSRQILYGKGLLLRE